MPRPDDLGDLDTAEYTELGQIADRFARALEASPANTRIEDFLPDGPEKLRLAITCELIKIDLENRWRRGKQILLELYLSRFPDLQGKTDISGLVFEEFRIRHQCGHNPALQEYMNRFPRHYEACKRQAVKEGLSSGISSINPLEDATSIESATPVVGIRHYEEGAVLFQHYTLLEFLDQGSFGQVWRAKDNDGAVVAIKIPKDPLNKKQTMNEMSALSQIQELHHEYLLETKNFWVEKNYLFIAMELADGGTLKDRLKWYKEQGIIGIPVPELLGYFQNAALALDYLHSKNKVHRDIKPANILLVGGKAKIADFGLVRELDLQASQSHTVVGSFAYMAPEMTAGRASARSDQYCLAVTYVELRQGRLPFGSSVQELLKRDNPDLSSLEPREKEVVEKALRKERSTRFNTCKEFVAELTQALKGGEGFPQVSVPARPQAETVEPRPKEPARAPDPVHAPGSRSTGKPVARPADVALNTFVHESRPKTQPVIHLPVPTMPEIKIAPSTHHEIKIPRTTQDEIDVVPPTRHDDERASIAGSGEKSSAKEMQPRPGMVLRKRYLLKKYLDKGGFSEVWQAQDRLDDDRPVAVKFPLKPINDDEQTGKDLKALKRVDGLKSDYLLQTRDYWVEEGRLFIVMEFADGGSLNDHVKNLKKKTGKAVPAEQLLEYLTDTAHALDYLHRRNMVHRDVKPSNILLVQDKAKLADFGLLRDLSEQGGPVAGAPAYMAPEMMRGDSNARSDQYSLAVAYVEMRQGRLPFHVKDLVDRDDPYLEALEPGEQVVVMQALEKDPDKRFATCTDFVHDLKLALKKKPRPAASGGLFKLLVAAAVLAGVVVGGWKLVEHFKQRRHELMTARWDELKGQPLDGSRQSLQQRHAALIRFRKDFPEENKSNDALKSLENDLVDLVRTDVARGQVAEAEKSIAEVAWLSNDRRQGLLDLVEEKKCAAAVEVLIQADNFPGAAESLKTCRMSEENRTGVSGRIQSGWLKILEKPARNNLEDLKKRHDDLGRFKELFGSDAVADAAQRNKKAVDDLLEKTLVNREFSQAIKIIEAFKLSLLNKKVEDAWWSKLDGDFQQDRLATLQEDLEHFANNFPDRPGLKDRRVELAARFKAGSSDGVRLAMAEKQGNDHLAVLRLLKDVKKNDASKNAMLEKAEAGLAGQLSKLSDGKWNAALEKVVAGFDELGLKDAGLEERLNLNKYRLELAWQPFITGKVDLNRTVSLLSGIPKKTADADRNFGALAALVDVYIDKKPGRLIDLVKVGNPPLAYHDNLLAALAQFEKDHKVLTFKNLVDLEQAVPAEHKSTLTGVLAETPERLLKDGWTPAPEWEGCLKFCDAVLNPAAQVNTTDWLKALRAECQVMLKSKIKPTPGDAVFPDAGWYGRYVESLIRKENKGSAAAAERLFAGADLLVAAKEHEVILKPEARVAMAQKLLETAVKDLPRDKFYECRFRTDQDALDAYHWIVLGLRLKPLDLHAAVDQLLISAPSNGEKFKLAIDLLLAAARKPMPDHDLVLRIADKLVVPDMGAEKLGSCSFPVLSSYVEALNVARAGQRRQRLLTYGKFLDVKKEYLAADNKEFFDVVLIPGVKLGWLAARTMDERAILANLHGRFRQELVKCDAGQLKNLRTWTAAEADLDKDNFGPFALAGAVLLEQSRRAKGEFSLMGGGQDQIDLLVEAGNATEKALQRAGPDRNVDKEDLSALYLNRSRQELDLGVQRYFSTFDKNYGKNYDAALEFADKANKLDASAASWQARGNALEKTGKFQLAREAFDKACELAQKTGSDNDYQDALIARGRCQYHAAIAPKNAERAKLLDLAQKDLQKAAAIMQDDRPARKVDALLFLADVLLNIDRQDAKIIETLEQAIKVTRDEKVRFLAEYQAAYVAYVNAGFAARSNPLKKEQALLWFKKCENYLSGAGELDQSLVAGLRRKLARYHFGMIYMEQTKIDRNIVAGVFDKYRKKKDTAADAGLLVERLRSYCTDELTTFLSADEIALGEVAAGLAESMAAKAAKYPRERSYWLNLQNDALGVKAQARFLFGTKPEQVLKEIDRCEAIRKDLEKLEFPIDRAADWRPSYVKALAYQKLYKSSQDAADLQNAKNAVAVSLGRAPLPTPPQEKSQEQIDIELLKKALDSN